MKKKKKSIFKYRLLTVSGKNIRLTLGYDLIDKIQSFTKYSGVEMNNMYVTGSGGNYAILIKNIVRIKRL